MPRRGENKQPPFSSLIHGFDGGWQEKLWEEEEEEKLASHSCALNVFGKREGTENCGEFGNV